MSAEYSHAFGCECSSCRAAYFNRPGARAADPPTSHAAAAAAKRFVPDHHAMITGALWRPMNCYTLARLTGLDHVAVARRMRELVDKGEVRDTGKTEPGPSGRACILWERILPSEGAR